MSVAARRSARNTIKGLNLHLFKGMTNPICINLMSISEGGDRMFKSSSFPLITDNIGPGFQAKLGYTR